jgi:glutaredoxin
MNRQAKHGHRPFSPTTRESDQRKLIMKQKAVFFHAGCPVCVTAERQLAQALDPARYDVEVVHLGEQPARLADAERDGVISVPALVIGGLPFHINFGAALADLR